MFLYKQLFMDVILFLTDVLSYFYGTPAVPVVPPVPGAVNLTDLTTALVSYQSPISTTPYPVLPYTQSLLPVLASATVTASAIFSMLATSTVSLIAPLFTSLPIEDAAIYASQSIAETQIPHPFTVEAHPATVTPPPHMFYQRAPYKGLYCPSNEEVFSHLNASHNFTFYPPFNLIIERMSSQRGVVYIEYESDPWYSGVINTPAY